METIEHIVLLDGLPSRAADNVGPAPMLQWVPIASLAVDRAYQREVLRRGRANICRIIENFSWSKFAPVVAAPIVGGRYALVDGQHRTIAAMALGFQEVPASIIIADQREQAAAFKSINGENTKVTRQQLHIAGVASGDPAALEIEDVCARAGVRILPYPIPADRLKPGETLAIATISRALQVYGRDTLITALQCIVETGDGNAGMLRADLIRGICAVLAANSIWLNAGERLLAAFDSIDLDDCIARIELVRQFGEKREDTLVRVLAPRLTALMQEPAR